MLVFTPDTHPFSFKAIVLKCDSVGFNVFSFNESSRFNEFGFWYFLLHKNSGFSEFPILTNNWLGPDRFFKTGRHCISSLVVFTDNMPEIIV